VTASLPPLDDKQIPLGKRLKDRRADQVKGRSSRFSPYFRFGTPPRKVPDFARFQGLKGAKYGEFGLFLNVYPSLTAASEGKKPAARPRNGPEFHCIDSFLRNAPEICLQTWKVRKWIKAKVL